jgi:hypothetical protein
MAAVSDPPQPVWPRASRPAAPGTSDGADPALEKLRQVAADVRDFQRRKSSRGDLDSLDLDATVARLLRAETALREGGYTLADDGSWHPPR